MKKLWITALSTVITFASLSGSAFAADHDPQAIAKLMKDAKLSLIDGIALAEKQSGPSISAKYEVDDGKLMLSVYTVPDGLGVQPEAATLTELSTDAAAAPTQFKSEVFADKEHIARAAGHLSMFQLSKLSLRETIAAAVAVRGGTPIDVRHPQVRNRKPVADVILLDKNQKAFTVSVDLASGKVIR